MSVGQNGNLCNMLQGLFVKRNIIEVAGQSSAKLSYDVQNREVVLIRNCKDCTLTVNGALSKLVMVDCVGCSLMFTGKVLTGLAEFIRCHQTNFLVAKSFIPTLQVDGCTDWTVGFVKSDFMGCIVNSGDCRNIVVALSLGATGTRIQWDQDEKNAKNLNQNLNQNQNQDDDPFYVKSDSLCQYITRRTVEGSLLTERVIREGVHGYPTTQREKDAADARDEKNMRMMEHMLREMLESASKSSKSSDTNESSSVEVENAK